MMIYNVRVYERKVYKQSQRGGIHLLDEFRPSLLDSRFHAVSTRIFFYFGTNYVNCGFVNDCLLRAVCFVTIFCFEGELYLILYYIRRYLLDIYIIVFYFYFLIDMGCKIDEIFSK